jgi:hypothetical protein
VTRKNGHSILQILDRSAGFISLQSILIGAGYEVELGLILNGEENIGEITSYSGKKIHFIIVQKKNNIIVFKFSYFDDFIVAINRNKNK